MGKRILIIGAGFLQVPMIKKAKEMNLYIGVVDYNPNAPGVILADEYINCSTNDKEGILDAAKKFKPDGIATMATDMPMRSIAYVCNKLKLKCIPEKTAYDCTNKIAMIKCFKKNNIPSPFFYEFNDIKKCKEVIEKLNTYPIIMKPSDSSGSRGVILINSLEEVEKAFNYSIKSSNDGYVIVEEYMEGPEVSVECFVVRGEPFIIQITDKITTGAPHFVETGHIEPSSLKYKIIRQIKELAKKACICLNIDSGPAHAEMIITKDGPKMVEIGARLGGDCITSHLVPLSTGVDMVKATLSNALNIFVDLEPKHECFSCVKFITSKIPYIHNISLPKNKKGDIIVEITKESGDVNTIIESSSDRIGYVIAKGSSYLEVTSTVDEYIKNIIIE